MGQGGQVLRYEDRITRGGGVQARIACFHRTIVGLASRESWSKDLRVGAGHVFSNWKFLTSFLGGLIMNLGDSVQIHSQGEPAKDRVEGEPAKDRVVLRRRRDVCLPNERHFDVNFPRHS
jgi:hypothetical protein